MSLIEILAKSSAGAKTNSYKKERWLELALAVDYTVIRFHGKEKIKKYILALMNIVSFYNFHVSSNVCNFNQKLIQGDFR